MTHSVPIKKGKIYYPRVVTLELSAAELIKYLEKLNGPHEHFEEIRQAACAIRPSRSYMCGWNSVERVLSNGQVIKIGSERFSCPEPLFIPSLLKQEPGSLAIQDAVYHSIQKCELGVRREMYANTFLTGGSTMFPGFDERLENERRRKSV